LGKESTMRRILWSLAASTAIGATVSWTMAGDPFAFPEQPAQRDPAANRSNVTFIGRSSAGPSGRTYSELLGEDAGRAVPPERTTLPRAGSLSDVRASDLFRREAARTSGASASPSTPTGEMLEDQFRRVSGEHADAGRDVVHAEYERLPGQRDRVEQVRSDARDFPAAGVPASTPDQESADSQFAHGYRPAATGNRLMQPIETAPTRPSFDRYAATPPTVQSSRGVTSPAQRRNRERTRSR
jgi:hypothetical protein